MNQTIEKNGEGHKKTFEVIVNGRPRHVTEPELSYEDVVKLAFRDDQADANILYTIAYANPHGKDGTLTAGEKVKIKEGMVFNVTKTNRS